MFHVHYTTRYIWPSYAFIIAVSHKILYIESCNKLTTKHFDKPRPTVLKINEACNYNSLASQTYCGRRGKEKIRLVKDARFS